MICTSSRQALLTDSVCGLIDTIWPDTIWPDTHIASPRWDDETLMCVLADALEEAGYGDTTVLTALRTANTTNNDSHWIRVRLIKGLRDDRSNLRAAHEQNELAAAHSARTASIVAELERISKEAYATRNVSKGYRCKTRAALIAGHPGYIKAVTHDLRGTPPPGTIWIRWSSGGKWSVSRKEKFGRKLTAAELRRENWNEC